MADRFTRDPQTEADVAHLMAAYTDLAADGRVVTHDALEGLLLVSRQTPRYRTVIRHWRRAMMRERGLYLDGITARGAGFVAAKPDETVRCGRRDVRSASRKLKRGLAVMSLPADDALSDGVRFYRSRLAVAINHLSQQHAASLRDVSRALASMPTLPKRALPA